MYMYIEKTRKHKNEHNSKKYIGKYFAICNLVIRIKFHFYCHLAFYFVNFCISEETAIKTVIFQFYAIKFDSYLVLTIFIL